MSFRWGILATGNIAKQFARDLQGWGEHRIEAVGSRSAESAAAFAREFGVPRAHGSYEALIVDPAIDAVYNSTPNSLHHEWTIRALRAGKHVLCEKPLAMNEAEAEEMFDEAQRQGRLLVEAFMYRSHPMTLAVLEQVRAGAIGNVRLIRTSFCFRIGKPAGNVRLDRALGGGALMDVGCYCVNFARLFAGAEPTALHATARMHESGVDEITTGTLAFGPNVLASFSVGMAVHADNAAYICGDEGYVQVPVPWKPPVHGAAYVLRRSAPPKQDNPKVAAAPPEQRFEVDSPGPLYAVEAEDFRAAVMEGKPPRLTREDSVGNMRVLDGLRAAIGLVF